MDDGTKRKLDDQLTKIAREFKYGNLSSPVLKSENGLCIKEFAENPSVKTSPMEVPSIGNDGQCLKNSVAAGPDFGPQEATEEVFCDVRLEVLDRNTLVWLESKQNALFFSEEYGVNLLKQEAPSSDVERKTESQLDPLCFRVSMATSETCNQDEAQWFVKQASNSLRGIALEGVFVKCFWYEGPFPPGNNGSPDISSVVKKIKGHDGKNLDRIQDRTGVIIDMVLDNKGTSVDQPGVNSFPHRTIGVRIRCIRRRGICEASKKVQRLLGLAADFFLKELRMEARVKNVVSSDLMQCISMPPISATMERNLTAIAQGQCSATAFLSSYVCSEKPQGEVTDEYSNRKLPDSAVSRARKMCTNVVSLLPTREPHFKNFYEESDNEVFFESRGRSNLLYVHDLPGNMPAWVLKSIFHDVLHKELALPPTCDIVVHAGFVSDHSAVVEFANHSLLAAAMELYENDETVFDGLKIALPQATISAPERPNSNYGMGAESVEQIGFSHGDQRYVRRDFFAHRNRYKPERSFIKHNQSYGKASPGWDYIGDQPKPLFLTGLIKNASAQSIGLLFEDIIKHFIGPPYASSPGRQSVLDVRYVHSKKCAFVDLATPELVEIMLDLYSQKPELFCYMKMEVGNRDIPDRPEHDISPSRFPSKCREDEELSRADWLEHDLSPCWLSAKWNEDEELGRADWPQHDIHPSRLPAKCRGHMRVHNNFESSGAYRFRDRDVKRVRCSDFPIESDEYYFGKPFDLRKRIKSDHVFAYRFPTETCRENIN